jgi:hypothetical protein
MSQATQCTHLISSGAQCQNKTSNPAGKCRFHIQSQKSLISSAHPTPIPRVDGSAPAGSPGIIASWDSMVPSFMKKNYKGESGIQRLFSGASSDERKTDALRNSLFDTFDITPFGPYLAGQRDAVESVSDHKQLEDLLEIGKRLRDMEGVGFPREGFISLIMTDKDAINDARANLEFIGERSDNLNRLVGIREVLTDEYGVTPNEDGLIPSLRAHGDVLNYLLDHPFYNRRIKYMDNPELVNAVQSNPNDADRVMEYFTERQQKPVGDQRMSDLKFTFDPENFTNYMSSAPALSEGVL